MIAWILQNREWLFSGVGVAVIAALIAILRRKPQGQVTHITISPLQSKASTSSPRYPFSTDEYSPRPLPGEIFSDIRSAPPYQQETKASSYAGMKVQWLLSLKSVYDKGGGKASVSFTEPKGHVWVYSGPVDIEAYPRLKVTHADTPIWIAGSIGPPHPGGVTINIDKLQFKDSV
ncbi:MAG: hypothetical protein ACYC99_06275 [Candidatus Geothermincolia bacterium]